MPRSYCVILNIPVLYSSISRVSWMTSRSWKLKSCRSMPHPLFPRRPTPTSQLVLLSVVFRDGRASSKRFASFPSVFVDLSAPGSVVDHLRVNLVGAHTNDSQNKKNPMNACRRGEIELQRSCLMERQAIARMYPQQQRTSVFQRIWT